ncbi:MAG TPA: HAMP domain-containing sensor histidine kinase [Candidatus Acidoferrales bacterium]|nr:HAMP domain-containing sensor histidine kinase [Candidatus Acidoferrales bacterium]
MPLLGFFIALVLFLHFKRRLQVYRNQHHLENDVQGELTRPASCQSEWKRQWADKFERQAERRLRHMEKHAQRRLRRLDREARRWGFSVIGPGTTEAAPDDSQRSSEEAILLRARRRAAAEVGFYAHLMSYLGVMAFLALVNLFTTSYPWFVWPALGWGIGLFSHYMAVFGSRRLRERYFVPAVEREVRREKMVMHTEKQASIDELSSTIAHEIRNPIAAAKSLVQQMGEDPVSVENVEYAKVALEELDRVERRISHLLKYAKEEDYTLTNVNIAGVVDSALTQMRAKLDAAKVSVGRNYIGGPTVLADAEKLRQVFANVLDNAIDAFDNVTEARRIDLYVENGSRGTAGARATVRIHDNGCGIPGDKLSRIFNPFFTTKEKGTGLGMAISKKIVEAHEGTIDVVSEPGRGTEFIVTLPLPQG